MKPGYVAWRLIRFRPVIWGVSLLLWIAFLTLPLVTGLIIRELFNLLSGTAQATPGPWSLVALLIGIEGVRIAALFGSLILWRTFWLICETLLRKNLLSWLLQGPGARHVPQSSGEAISRFRDDINEMMLFLDTFGDILGEGLFTITAIIIMFQINPVITVVMIAPLLGIVLFTQLMTTRIKTYRKASLEATGNITGFISDTFSAILSIKAANAEERLIRRFDEINHSRQKAMVRERIFGEVLNSFNLNTVNIGIGIILLLSAQLIHSGEFSIGDFALFVGYFSTTTSLPRWVGRSLALYKQSSVSIDRMSTILQGSPATSLVTYGPVYLREPAPAPVYTPKTANDRLELLEATDLTYHYPASGKGIEGINLRIKRGSFTVITGRVGSGKTTLLRTLLGLVKQERGSIYWNGQLIDDPATFLVPPRCAYTPQSPRLFSETLRQNMLLGLPEEHVDLQQAIQLAVLEQDIPQLQDKLETLIGPRGARLSGGQVQRAAIARMLVRDTELLIFDDPSSALDIETERTLWQRLFACRDAATCLVVSHRPIVFSRADHIIVLKEGRVESEGPLEVVLKASAELRDL